MNELLHGTERRARGRAGNNTLMLCKSARTLERLRVADLDYLVHKRHIHGLGNKIVSDSLDVVIAVLAAAHGRTDGISHNAADGGVLLL